MKVLLLAQDKHLLRHPISLASSLSCRNLKSFKGALDRNNGAPKYIVFIEPFHLKNLFNFSALLFLTMVGEKHTGFTSI